MKVKDIMTKKVISLREGDHIESVIKRFARHRITGAPVIDKNKKVIGIVTESDIIRAIDVYTPKIRIDTDSMFGVVIAVLDKKHDEFSSIKKELRKATVKDFMENTVVTISPEESITSAIRLMNKYEIKRLPVVKKNKLVGIISRVDVIMALEK